MVVCSLTASDARAQHMLSSPVEYRGPCDASAAVAVDATRFLVANNEDSVIRLYRHADASSNTLAPLAEYDMREFLGADAEHPGTDIEGATRDGLRIYWITSHGRDSEGKTNSSRYRFWATELKLSGASEAKETASLKNSTKLKDTANSKAAANEKDASNAKDANVKDKDTVKLETIGKPYTKLADDLAADKNYARYRLKEAMSLGKREPGTFNIEGLAATPDGRMLIGLRGPPAAGRAILITLENPAEVVEQGVAPKFGPPIELAGGGGIRGLEYWPARKQYVMLFGPTRKGEKIPFQIALWSGKPKDQPRMLDGLSLGDMHPETVVVYDHPKRVQIISDDGNRSAGARDCKELDPDEQRFRSVWLQVGK